MGEPPWQAAILARADDHLKTRRAIAL